MADQFENQLPQKNDAKWVRALDASGNPIRKWSKHYK